ncbi:transposase [Streptomyces celluloflavus]|uniref:transposase n=1 Tax=Streptomyces celluloflavus TaxID=58344 RepID=UPI0036980517
MPAPRALHVRHEGTHRYHRRQPARHQAATDPLWQDEYRHWRPPVERGIAWLTRHSRRLRYPGVLKNDAWLHTRTATLNLRRLVNLGLEVADGTWTVNPATA